MQKHVRIFIGILILVILALQVVLPASIPVKLTAFGKTVDQTLVFPLSQRFPLKQGLDIQGGIQVVLRAKMDQVAPEDRVDALESARQVILRRVDLYGVNEPLVQTSQVGNDSRILVELAGIEDPSQALALIGQTAQLEFKLQKPQELTATPSANYLFDDFVSTELSGTQLKRAQLSFDQTGQPVVSLQFTPEGTQTFAKLTQENTGKVLGIFLDGVPLMLPVIQTPILDGQAMITGAFTLEQAKNLSIQLNAGALPVPIEVLEQRSIGASLGQRSIELSLQAGLVGLALVIFFMVNYYGMRGLISAMALSVYALLTLAAYRILGVTLTLPGIAGLILSIGMAVDSNILIFERIKEELRAGKAFTSAMEQGFGKAWDSIKDANVVTIFTALVLMNPLNLSFLSTSGLVRGFGLTLFIGVLISLFTGIVVTRTFMRLFLRPTTGEKV
jgi:preprotein translocase subunit SecD